MRFMDKALIEKYHGWFDGYVRGFYSDDQYLNANIKLKEDHSKRVCEEMRYLADAVGLDEDQKLIAEAIASWSPR